MVKEKEGKGEERSDLMAFSIVVLILIASCILRKMIERERERERRVSECEKRQEEEISVELTLSKGHPQP